MSRLIQVPADRGPGPDPELAVGVGDLLSFSATGGRVRDGTAVELLGAHTAGVVGTDGRVLTPQGPPSTVLFRAREPGRAELEVVTGPWGAQTTRSVQVRVTGGAG